MKHRVVRHAQVRADLLDQFVYLAEHADADVARRFLRAVHDASKSLAETPLLGWQRSFSNPRLRNVRFWALRDFPEHP